MNFDLVWFPEILYTKAEKYYVSPIYSLPFCKFE